MSVKTTAKDRVCFLSLSAPFPCGRRKGAASPNLGDVTCSDCLAAMRADGMHISAHQNRSDA